MLFLEIGTLDIGDDVRAVGLDLRAEDEEPARGPEAAAIWARVLPALAGDEEWALDFFAHLNRVRDYCERHSIAAWEEPGHALVVPAPPRDELEALCARFEGETFGARAGQALAARDAELERELVRRGLDAYHRAFSRYFFCAVCDFVGGSLLVLSEELGDEQVLELVRAALDGLEVEVVLGS